MTEPCECLLLEAQAVELAVTQPGTAQRLMALVSTAHLLRSHGGWRFPNQLPTAHIEAMLATERRFHGVVADGYTR